MSLTNTAGDKLSTIDLTISVFLCQSVVLLKQFVLFCQHGINGCLH